MKSEFDYEVVSMSVSDSGTTLLTSKGDVAASVISCGRLHADRLAATTGDARTLTIISFRGDYWQLRPDAVDSGGG